MNKYSQRQAIVQMGWKTHLVSSPAAFWTWLAIPGDLHPQIMAVIALVIAGTSVTLLVVNILDSHDDL